MAELSTLQDAARVAIALALGKADEGPPPREWPRTLAVAHGERIAVLGWLRSGEYIRATAPKEIVASWRATAVRADDLARAQWNRLCELVDRLEVAGVRPVVLKGLPLAARLYGDAAARVSCDVDLYVTPDERETAHEVVCAAGWRRWVGEAPWDAAYMRSGDGRMLYLELHSMLTGEALAHCGPLAIEAEAWDYEGARVQMMAADTLPVYLAANLAKHVPVPLLSCLDFAVLWRSLDEDRRRGAFVTARTARLERCLRWAVRQAASMADAASGDVRAMRRLGVRSEGRRAAHGHVRLIWLADSPGDATRVLGSWIWPRSTRGSLRLTRSFWAQRLRGSFSGKLIQRRSYDHDAHVGTHDAPSTTQRIVRSSVAMDLPRTHNPQEVAPTS